jgi:hypothetical protein
VSRQSKELGTTRGGVGELGLNSDGAAETNKRQDEMLDRYQWELPGDLADRNLAQGQGKEMEHELRVEMDIGWWKLCENSGQTHRETASQPANQYGVQE